MQPLKHRPYKHNSVRNIWYYLLLLYLLPVSQFLMFKIHDNRLLSSPERSKEDQPNLRISPKTCALAQRPLLGPRPVAVFFQLFKHPREQLLDHSKGEESCVLLLRHEEKPHLKHQLYNFLLYHQQEMETYQETHRCIFAGLLPIFLSFT